MKKDILQERSKRMREDPTPAEAILAAKLTDIKVKFHRQWVIAPYIADFYIPSLSLILEVDGKIHDERKEYDERRDSYLRSKSKKVVRISNTMAFRIKRNELRELIGLREKKTPPKPNPQSRRSKIRQFFNDLYKS